MKKTISKGSILYRVRNMDNSPVPNNRPVWFIDDKKNIVILAFYRKWEYDRLPENERKEFDLCDLKYDTFTCEEDITLDSPETYVTMEMELAKANKFYKPVMKHEKGKLEVGDNTVPANEYERRKLTGWYFPLDANSFMAEVMITSSHVKKLKLSGSESVVKYLDKKSE